MTSATTRRVDEPCTISPAKNYFNEMHILCIPSKQFSVNSVYSILLSGAERTEHCSIRSSEKKGKENTINVYSECSFCRIIPQKCALCY